MVIPSTPISQRTYSFASLVEYLQFVQKNAHPDIINLMKIYYSLHYVREFINQSYKHFDKHTSKTRTLISVIAKQLSKLITGLMQETHEYTNIEAELFLGSLKILLNDLEEFCIINKNNVKYFSINDGGVEITIELESYIVLEKIQTIDFVDRLRKNPYLKLDFNTNEIMGTLLSGISFVGGV